MIVGQGEYRYEVAEGWGRLPAGWDYGDVNGVATDSQDRVYIFTRSEHPVIVFDREGQLLGSWGEGIFRRPHGVTITPDDVLWCTDDTDHTVRKFTVDGKLLQTLGIKDQPSDSGYVGATGPGCLLTIRRGAGPFNRPTKVAVAPNGDLYITDGYGNARVHRFSASGEYIQSWGEPGEGPGQFMLPHSLFIHRSGRVFVCDRENNRVQILSLTGEYLGAWTDLLRPAELWIDKDDRVYLGELYWDKGVVDMVGRVMPETRPGRVSVRDLDGKILSSWGGPDPFAPGSFSSAHGLCVDSHGDIYVGEVALTALGRTGRYGPCAHSIQKFIRLR
jgi:hypothetical protein